MRHQVTSNLQKVNFDFILVSTVFVDDNPVIVSVVCLCFCCYSSIILPWVLLLWAQEAEPVLPPPDAKQATFKTKTVANFYCIQDLTNWVTDTWGKWTPSTQHPGYRGEGGAHLPLASRIGRISRQIFWNLYYQNLGLQNRLCAFSSKGEHIQ